MRITIEVSATEVLDGIGKITGTLVLSGDVIELVYYKTTLLGSTSETAEVEIPLTEIQGAELKKIPGLLKVILYPKRLGILRDIPGAHKGKITFQVQREDRPFATRFVGAIEHALHEQGVTGMVSIPFQMESTNMGFQEHWGLLYMEEEFVVLDLHSGLSGVTRAERHVIKIDPVAIMSIRLGKGGLKDTVFIEPKKDTLLRVLPGDHRDEIRLKLKKEHRQAAARLISRIQYAIENS